MKYVYFAVEVEENGKRYAYVMKDSGNNNLWSRFKSIPGLVSVTIMPTKKQAAAVVTAWNDGYRRNGCYMFDDPKF